MFDHHALLGIFALLSSGNQRLNSLRGSCYASGCCPNETEGTAERFESHMHESAAELAPEAALPQHRLPLTSCSRSHRERKNLLLNLAERNQPCSSGSPPHRRQRRASPGLLEAAAVKMEFATFEMMGVLAKRSAEPWANKSSLVLNGPNKNDAQVTASSLFEQAGLVEAHPKLHSSHHGSQGSSLPGLDLFQRSRTRGFANNRSNCSRKRSCNYLARLDPYAGEPFAKEIISKLAPADSEKDHPQHAELLKLDSAWATRLGEQVCSKRARRCSITSRRLQRSAHRLRRSCCVFSRQSIGTVSFMRIRSPSFGRERAVARNYPCASEALRGILKNESSAR